MSSITDVPSNQKSAYQRPYKTRSERREIARRKHDENADHKFLVRVAMVAGVLLLIAVGAALKGWADRETEAPVVTEVSR